MKSRVVKFKQQGHGALDEVMLSGSEKEKISLLDMLDKMFRGEDILDPQDKYNSNVELALEIY